jgi:hypothetical protein
VSQSGGGISNWSVSQSGSGISSWSVSQRWGGTVRQRSSGG